LTKIEAKARKADMSMPGLIMRSYVNPNAGFCTHLPHSALPVFFTDRIQPGNQDHNRHRNIQSDLRCDLFAGPPETALPGKEALLGYPTDRRALIKDLTYGKKTIISKFL
jgi:hypothetical protein